MTESTSRYLTALDMYGEQGDLGSNPAFAGGFINYGYWGNIDLDPTQPISESQRIQSSIDLYRRLFGSLHVVGDDSILEVGCGRGAGLRLLRGEYSLETVVGVDFSPHQVARSLEGSTRGRIQLVQATAEALPFTDGGFTKAFSLEAIQHFNSGERFIKELGRTVREDGSIAIASFFATTEAAVPEITAAIPTFRRGIDKAIPINKVQDWLKESNFEGIRVESIGKDVWEPFVRWCTQVIPHKSASSGKWLAAHKNGLLDYYIITATKGKIRVR